MRSLGHEKIETTMIYLEKIFEKERHAIHGWNPEVFGEYTLMTSHSDLSLGAGGTCGAPEIKICCLDRRLHTHHQSLLVLIGVNS